MIRSMSGPQRCLICSSRSVANIGENLPEEPLLGDSLEGLDVLGDLPRDSSPMMPHDVVFMHLIARVIGESYRLKLFQGGMVPLGKRAHLALGQKKPLLQLGDPQRYALPDDRLALCPRERCEGFFKGGHDLGIHNPTSLVG